MKQNKTRDNWTFTPNNSQINDLTNGECERHGKRLITVSSRGRMGNHMFEYAGLLNVAHHSNRTPILTNKFHHLKNIFKITAPICSYDVGKFTIIDKKHINEMIQYNNYSYIPTIQNDVLIHSYLVGYHKFSPVRHKVRKEFQFSDAFLKSIRSFVSSQTNSTVHIGVHIRGTDMNSTYYRDRLLGTPPVSYFYAAMDYFRNIYDNTTFIVCSDDIKWAARNIYGSDVIYSHNHTAEFDLVLLATCNHVIISRGDIQFLGGMVM